MDYLALYRKYRPKELDEVVGQVEIKKILASSIRNNTISHAYLFSGPRGTGKTTMAKILAKMVNCEHHIDGNPCNNCNSCLNLFNSNDVIEIDAASNNGVDEIRDLREKANLVPSTCKYKVYIIDEVHMLTTQAFNALLKTLEEPPKHVIFVLATTEYYKIPLTITSRCQKFQFNKIKENDIVFQLRKISDLENIDIDDEALMEIAKISDGGMRDSINFLDQLRSFSSSKITIDDVYDVCGNVSSIEISKLLVDIKEGNAEEITMFFENMDAGGKNYSKFFEDIVCLLKDVILYKKDVSSKFIKSNVECVKKVSDVFSLNDIFYIVKSINDLIDKLKFVSRQSVVVISSFLIIMNDLDNNNLNNKNSFENNENDKKIEYEMAFNFTSDKKNKDVELTSNVLHEEEKEKNIEERLYNNNNNNNNNKTILINNAFSVANKDVKNALQVFVDNVQDYLTDKIFSSAAGIFMDTKLEVAGDGYVIFSGNYDAVVDKVYTNYKLCEEFLNKLFNKKYNFVVITIQEWEKYKEEYIKNIKSGKKYELLELENTLIDENICDKEPTIVDKLFELVGEDIIEFK